VTHRRSAGWIDVSRPLAEGMIHWPGDLPYQLERVAEITEPGDCNLSELHTGVHAGTHIDAPLHFIADGEDVASLSLDLLCGSAIVVHAKEPRDVGVSDLEPVGIERGDRVLLRTVNEHLWQRPAFDESFVGISGEAASWLAARKVAAVGVDYLSIDRFHDSARPAHHRLLGAGIIVIEGVDLAGVNPGRYEMVALPLRMIGAEGSPARVILRSPDT
jgi:arylformamidase